MTASVTAIPLLIGAIWRITIFCANPDTPALLRLAAKADIGTCIVPAPLICRRPLLLCNTDYTVIAQWLEDHHGYGTEIHEALRLTLRSMEPHRWLLSPREVLEPRQERRVQITKDIPALYYRRRQWR